MNSDIKTECISPGITRSCCTGTTGCEWDGTLRDVKVEPIFVQKVYDATLVNMQALKTITNLTMRPNLGRGARIIKILNIRCRKFFNPKNINDKNNLIVTPKTEISGGNFVKDETGKVITVVGPDGLKSQKIIFVDTTDCDKIGKGTPIFGTQTVTISGKVIIEIDAIVQDCRRRRTKVTLTAESDIASCTSPIIMTNFFELCIPSVFNSAFLPRFAEFCNILCETRLATNNINRDLTIDPNTGTVRANLITAICISCEKKIIVPVQLCVLSTGFPELSPEISPICTTFPSLFPEQIDKNDDDCCSKPDQRTFSLDETENIDKLDEVDYTEEYNDSLDKFDI